MGQDTNNVTGISSAHVQSLEELAETEQTFRTLVECLPDAILVHSDGKLVFVNPFCVRLLAAEGPDELIGKNIADIVRPDCLPAIEKRIQTCYLTNQASPPLESTLIACNGSPVEVEAVAIPISWNRLPAIEVVLRDTSKRKRAEESAYKWQQRLELAQKAGLRIGLWDWNIVANTVNWSDESYRQFGFTRDLFSGRVDDAVARIHSDDRLRVQNAIRTVLEGKAKKYAEQYRVVWPDGSTRWIDAHGVMVCYKSTHMIGVGVDITELKEIERALQEGEEKYRLLLDSTAEAIYGLDLNGDCTFCNSACLRLLGYRDPQELLGRNMHALMHHSRSDGSPFPLDECALYLAVREGRASHVTDEIIWRADGTNFSAEYWSYPMFRAGELVGAVVTFLDVSERKQAEERVQFLAYYDALTELPNRTLLKDRLEKALASARRRSEKVALLFLDIDHFKTINDSLGHSVGDQLLQEVAQRLKDWARSQDTVSRIGGDEFLIALNGIKDAPDAAIAAERLMEALTGEFIVHGRRFSLSSSIGVAIYPEHGLDTETLIRNADAAMYRAKECGRNRSCFFTAEMNADVVERLNIEHNLRHALEKNQLFLVYQPQMDLISERIIGVEALIRWQHPEMGLVPPDKFIGVAENTGLILPIGEWVLRTACAAARHWQDERLAVPVAVNVSAVQFRQDGFRDLVERVLRDSGLAPHLLELELTETLLMLTGNRTFLLQEFKNMGVKLAIDDFGTGYSSLSYLRHFPVNRLKIDRSFIKAVDVSADDAAITSAIISMGHSLNLKVMAEGVENEAQISFLRRHQCHEAQGYYFSKPLLPDEIEDKLRSNRARPSTADQATQPYGLAAGRLK